jgi:hypothetical protein
MADASGKKTKKIATARKNSNANAHCTHLPLPATAQANPKAKSKECNRQRFPKPNIFTTNYDLYSEIALDKLGIHYVNGFFGRHQEIF